MPLKGISSLLSPDLLFYLAKAGHGDEIILADAHFPTSSICRNNGPVEVRADGIGIPALLKAVLELLPLDSYVPCPVATMQLVASDAARGLKVPIWEEYHTIVDNAEKKHVLFEEVERFEFYARSKNAFVIVHTGETAPYGNIILKKGLVLPTVD